MCYACVSLDYKDSRFYAYKNTKRKADLSSVFLSAVRGGFEPPVRKPVRQFSKLVVSATHPSHQTPFGFALQM